jgi:hypothetical protein
MADENRFHAKATIIPAATSGVMQTAVITVFNGDKTIGSYERNYPAFGEETFAPFAVDGQWYALYSPDYTGTRLMALPSCKDLGGEEPASNGFCPVELFVPRYRMCRSKYRNTGEESELWTFDSNTARESSNEYEVTYGPWIYLDTGFVAGCIWGDDSSWKLETIDLTAASEGG